MAKKRAIPKPKVQGSTAVPDRTPNPLSPKGKQIMTGKPATADDIAVLKKQRERTDSKIKQKIKDNVDAPDNGRSPESDPVKEFLAIAMERWNLAADAERSSRKESLDDLKFSIGEQWDGQVKSRRELDGRPCLTINRLPQFIRYITNEQRQQRPGIQINPVGDGATKKTARILQGMTRHIEVNSDAEVAYDNGGEFAVRIGFGYWRLIREYLPGKTFDQEIKIKRIKNPFTVYFDPNAVEHDYSDADWAFIIEDVPRAVYLRDHPESNIASLSNLSSVGDAAKEWMSRETIRVAEYFYAVYSMQKIAFLPHGEIVDFSEVPPGVTPVAVREVPIRNIYWAKITALDVIEGNEDKTAGKDIQNPFIPIVPVLADDFDVDGRRYLAGLVRGAKDPQRMYNYWVTAATETIALAPKAPFIGAIGQFASKEEMWRQANVRNFSFLEYDPKTLDGQLIGPPVRNAVEPPIQAMGGMIRQADADLKGSTGIYEASLGQRSPDESGKAVLARQKQGDVGTLNYSDNLARSIRHTGRVILAWIPTTYDKSRIQRIINPDQSVEHVGIYNSAASGGQTQDPQQIMAELQEKAVEGIAIQQVFDVGVGIYDVTVSVGPSYQSKRQEAVSAMMSLVSSYPVLMQAAGDLLISNMDWPGAEAIASRLKKLLPPPLQDVNSADPEVRLTALQSQMQVMMQQHQALVGELNKATQTINTKTVEAASKERIAAMNAQVQILIAQAKVAGEGALAKMDGELQMIMHRLDLLHINASIEDGVEEPSAPPAGPPSSPPPVGGA